MRSSARPDLWVATYAAAGAETADDDFLDAELAAAGLYAVRVAWDDPDVVWEDAGGVLLRTMWDYHRRIDAFRAWLDLLDATGVRVWNPTSVVRANTDKRYLAGLAAAGVATVPTLFVGPDEDCTLPEALAAAGLTNGVIKPAVSADADGLAVVGAEPGGAGAARDRARWDALVSRGCTILVQPRLAALAHDGYGETSVVVIDGEITHAVRKHPAPGDIRVQPNHGGRVGACEPSPAERAVVAQVLATFSETPLFARVDLAPGDAASPLLMELELIEPELFFRVCPDAARRMAERVAAELRSHG